MEREREREKGESGIKRWGRITADWDIPTKHSG